MIRSKKTVVFSTVHNKKLTKAPTSMNQVPTRGFFSCLWHGIIKKERREKEEKREEEEKKEREKRGEKIHKFKS